MYLKAKSMFPILSFCTLLYFFPSPSAPSEMFPVSKQTPLVVVVTDGLTVPHTLSNDVSMRIVFVDRLQCVNHNIDYNVTLTLFRGTAR